MVGRYPVVAVLPQLAKQNKSRGRRRKSLAHPTRAVSQAKAVERDAPDLAEKVKAGQMALDAADRERKRREAAKPKSPTSAEAGACAADSSHPRRPGDRIPEAEDSRHFQRDSRRRHLVGWLVMEPGHRLPSWMRLLLRARHRHQ